MDKLDLAELALLINLLRADGITHFKCGDLELTLGAVPASDVGRESEQDQKTAQMTELEKALDRLPPTYRQAFTAQAGESS